MEVVASLSQGRTAAAQCGLFTHKSVPVIFEPPCKTEAQHQAAVGHFMWTADCLSHLPPQPTLYSHKVCTTFLDSKAWVSEYK